jgi:hypothetical protein
MASEGYFFIVDPGLMFEELEYLALNSNDGMPNHDQPE